MNNAKMWLVVKPTVGVPLFLSAVAVGSFAVHVAVLSNTTWVSDFLSGKPLGAAMAAATTDQVQPHVASYLPQGSQEVLVTLPDGTTARAILQLPETMAALK
jgi:light-harvesting protein B-800-850 alpha chain